LSTATYFSTAGAGGYSGGATL